MEEQTLRALASLGGGHLSALERREALDRILQDKESTDPVRLLGLPELSPENNLPLPFEIVGAFHGAVCKDFILGLGLDGFELSGDSKTLVTHLARIVAGSPQALFRKHMDLQAMSSEGAASLRLKLSREGTVTLLHVTCPGSADSAGEIEFWERGELVRRSSLPLTDQAPPFRVQMGVAVTVKHSLQDGGHEILLSDTEFSAREWTAAARIACVEGSLGEALRILSEELSLDSAELGWVHRAYRLIGALQAMTRSDDFILRPIPAVRAPIEDLEWRSAVISPVWEGIRTCWPEARSLRFPDSTGDSEVIKESVSGLNLDQGVSEFVKSFFLVANGLSVSSEDGCERSPREDAPTRLQNGWAGLRGWGALMEGKCLEAREAFESAGEVEGDPFSLRLGEQIAEHLMLFRSEASDDRVELSSDLLWGEIFPTAP